MRFLRRLLYVPLIIVLTGALLLIFNVISLDIDLPLSIEAIATIAGVILTGLLIIDARATAAAWEHPEPEEPPVSTKVIYPKTLEETVEAMQEAEDFLAKANGRVEISIDIEEEYED